MKTHSTTPRHEMSPPAMTGPVAGRKPVLGLPALLLWSFTLLLPVLRAQPAAVLTTLHSFQALPNGANPYAGLVRGSDGSFYGTTCDTTTDGGNGTVFRISTNGALTTLYSFTGGNDGANPYAGLVQGSDGNFYGTTCAGGTNGGYGTVFKMSTNGALTSLYSFTGGADGAEPAGGLVQGSDGTFYGTTAYGGANGYGTVFKISASGAFRSLYSFGGDDGADPCAGLVQGSDGFFYGTTASGGTNWNNGTVFKISASGTFTCLYAFTGGSDGANPEAGLAQGSDGSFYGTAANGGTNGGGTVFKISASGALTDLYSFTGGDDGGEPLAGLVQGRDGSFYGATMQGGTNGGGTVFKISADGVLTSLYSFTGGNDGANPEAGLAQGSDGNFYGTTFEGGTNGNGTVFKISAAGALTSLYSFPGVNDDGADPAAGLVQGGDGNFYGTTSARGPNGSYGTVFTISASGAFSNLYSFTGGTDGADPAGELVQGSDGSFYGTTASGGTNGNGTVFSISASGAFSSLYSFTGGTDGAKPAGGLVQGGDGNFYGTAAYGGTNGNGTVFKISANGTLANLYSFTGGNDGANPTAKLAQGNDGSFYGTTSQGGAHGSGTVFKISATGALTSLYSFTGGADGADPAGGLVQGSDGSFYGTTGSGGIFEGVLVSVWTGTNYGSSWVTNSLGTVFKISATGVLTTLYAFTGGSDGGYPQTALVQGSDGYFYGTTYERDDFPGHAPMEGTVFKISASGAFMTMYSFPQGANPKAALAQGSDGSFYGTTSSGGLGVAGTVFRLTLVPQKPALTLTGRTLNLTWNTEVGRVCQLQYTSDLSSANWTNLGSPFTATRATFSATESVLNAPQRFYRLALLP